jgi:hypothetical protein
LFVIFLLRAVENFLTAMTYIVVRSVALLGPVVKPTRVRVIQVVAFHAQAPDHTIFFVSNFHVHVHEEITIQIVHLDSLTTYISQIIIK